MQIGIPCEHTPGETRVALTPESCGRLIKAGVTVLVERGAGLASGYSDAAYEKVGATLTDAAGAFGADLVAKVQKPTAAEAGRMRAGSHLVSLLQPATSAA